MYNKIIVPLKGLKNGYVQFRDPNHPLAYASDGTVYLHRHVASMCLGRWIRSSEIVHHKDENRLNNDPSNLEVMTQEEHSAHHNKSLLPVYCTNCSKEFVPAKSNIKLCSKKCVDDNKIKNKELTKELLDSLIPKYTWTALGSMFGYSDNGIKKRAKTLGCIIPTRKNTK